MTVSRRAFIASSAAAAVTLQQATARADVNNTVRAAVLGVNGRGRTHIAHLEKQPETEVAVLCDPDEKVLGVRAEEFEKTHGRKVETETDLRNVLDRKDIDLVTIAMPNHWHALATILACQAGKDVYVEKPGSHNIYEGRKMVEAANKYKRIVQHGVQLRSSPSIREGVEKMRNGVIGDVYMARGLVFRRRGSIGNQPDEANPPNISSGISGRGRLRSGTFPNDWSITTGTGIGITATAMLATREFMKPTCASGDSMSDSPQKLWRWAASSSGRMTTKRHRRC